MNTDRIHRGDTAVHLTDLIPDLDDFVRTAFDVRPVVLPGAMAHRLDHLPTAAVLDRLLQLDVLPSELVRMSRSGQGLPVNSYTRHVGQTHLSTVVDRAKVMQLFRSGATLTVNDLQQVWPTALDLVRVVGDAFACGAEATAFATPAGRAGFAPHSDELGVLVVQAEGTKDWRVWPTDLAGPRTRATFEDGTLGEPMFAVTLEPGDVLYLPQGTPHAAAATHEQSIHLSLGLRPRSWNDIVTAVVSTHLDPQGRTQFPALTAGHTEGLAGDLCMQLRELGALADTIDPVAALRAVREDVPGATLRFDGDGLADLRRLDACPPTSCSGSTGTPWR